MISERHRLDSLYKIARTLRQQDADVQTVLQTALGLTSEAVGVKHGCLLTFYKDDKINTLYILGSDRNAEARREMWNRLVTQGLIGYVHHGQRTIVIHDIDSDPRWPRLPDTPFIPKTGSAVGVPLQKDGEIYGVITLIHPQVEFFDSDVVEMLEAIADMVSATIGSAIAFNLKPKDETRYQWLFQDAVVPIILTDLHGYIVDANTKACEFLRYEPRELIGMPISTVHRMGTGPLGMNRFESLHMGNEVEFQTTAWTAENRDIIVNVRARRLFFDNHDVISWVEQDITAQMELEQLRRDLTAMVYHDLRGPLQTIYSSLSALGRFLVNTENNTVIDLLQVGIRGTRQLSRMIESLLDIQRLEEGKAILDRKPTSLHSVLANAAQLVQPLAAEAEQRLMFELGDELPYLTIDADMILRVVTNLMENAVKYTPMGGTIRLNARVTDNGVCISIMDSGPGIPKHMQRQIFDKFSRVKYTDGPKGIGLGLAFCRLAVEAHNGTIWVESEPEQGGSTFSFTLPLVAHIERAKPTPV
jgi:two-component system, NtrC family, sensor histidine kinase KinB